MASPKKNRAKLTEIQMLIVARKICDKAGLFFCQSRRSAHYLLYRKCESRNVLIAEPKTPATLLSRVKKAAGSVASSVSDEVVA